MDGRGESTRLFRFGRSAAHAHLQLGLPRACTHCVLRTRRCAQVGVRPGLAGLGFAAGGWLERAVVCLALTMRTFEVQAGQWNRRFGVELDDGARVECVLYRGDSLCVSAQVGCAVGCPFCASGAQGLERNLSVEELIGQLEQVRALGHAPRRITISGVGEPLHNLAAVRALIAHCRPLGLGVSLTSSGGDTKKLGEALRLEHRGLTLSVHAGSEALRARLVPRGPSLAQLFGCLERELVSLGRNRRKKVALAYLLLEGQNDADAELDAFAARVGPLGLRVHLYAHNPVASSELRGVSRPAYEQAYARLSAAGLRVSMSSQARLELNGGCGTLLALRSKPERAHAAALRVLDPARAEALRVLDPARAEALRVLE
jgi:23S rRNA (adenine2503-C2)-methyltransferase